MAILTRWDFEGAPLFLSVLGSPYRAVGSPPSGLAVYFRRAPGLIHPFLP